MNFDQANAYSIANSRSLLGSRTSLNLVEPQLEFSSIPLDYAGNPLPINASIKRFGHYLEAMVACLCAVHPALTVLERNVLIKDHGSVTGEADLVLARSSSGWALALPGSKIEIEHWEITGKFLLYRGYSPRSLASFVGLDATDSLERKLQHLREKQVLALQTSRGRDALLAKMPPSIFRDLVASGQPIIARVLFIGRIYLPAAEASLRSGSIASLASCAERCRDGLTTDGNLARDFAYGIWLGRRHIQYLDQPRLRFSILTNLEMFHQRGDHLISYDQFAGRIRRLLDDFGVPGVFFRVVDADNRTLEGAIVGEKWESIQV